MMFPDYDSSDFDSWHYLRNYTNARIALGRVGSSIPTAELLKFRLAHAQARDAVFSKMDMPSLLFQLDDLLLDSIEVSSEANGREAYLKNPSLGKKLSPDSKEKLLKEANGYDLCFIIADGLSGNAINIHAAQVIRLLLPALASAKWKLSPVVLASQARVALTDEVGSLLKAEIVIMLIGERPGLTAPDSMSAYITYKPTLGLTDERRNCISNIHLQGLFYQDAADKIYYLISEMKKKKISGVQLKDRQILLDDGASSKIIDNQ